MALRRMAEMNGPDPASGKNQGSENFPKTHRLRRRPEFLTVQRLGRRVHTPHFVVVLLDLERPAGVGGTSGTGRRRNQRQDPEQTQFDRVRGQRIGITVTKKVANAVGRNRVKRILRDVFRRDGRIFPRHCDLVVIAKQGAPALGRQQVFEELSAVSNAMKRALKRNRRNIGSART